MKRLVFIFLFCLTVISAESQQIKLPQNQIAMHLNKGCYFAGETLWFKIYNRDTNAKALSQSSEIAFIELLNKANQPILRQKVRLKSGVGFGELVLPDSLSTHQYCLMAYTNLQKNFGEEYFCKTTISVIGKDCVIDKTACSDEPLSVEKSTLKSKFFQLEKATFAAREKVKINLQTESNALQTGNYSISVNLKQPKAFGANAWSIGSKPSHFPELKYHPDYKGIVFSGKLENSNEQAIENASIIATSPGKNVTLLCAKTDKYGHFKMLLPPTIGKKDIILTSPETCKLSIDETFWNGLKNPVELSPVSFNQENINYINQTFINHQLNKRFNVTQQQQTLTPPETQKDTTNFYGTPDIQIDFENFVELDSLHEYFYELVPSVTLSKKQKRYNFKIFHPELKNQLPGKPAVFVDGVYYTNADNVAKLNHKSIDKIDIITEEYYFQNLHFGGIISIFTKKGDFSQLPLLDNSTRMLYPMSEVPSLFGSPNYEEEAQKSSSLPDLRTTLFWEPEISMQPNSVNELSFFTSDVSGVYTITICGINAEGEFVISECDFEVNVK